MALSAQTIITINTTKWQKKFKCHRSMQHTAITWKSQLWWQSNGALLALQWCECCMIRCKNNTWQAQIMKMCTSTCGQANFANHPNSPPKCILLQCSFILNCGFLMTFSKLFKNCCLEKYSHHHRPHWKDCSNDCSTTCATMANHYYLSHSYDVAKKTYCAE